MHDKVIRTVDHALQLIQAEELPARVDQKAAIREHGLVLDARVRQNSQAALPAAVLVPPDQLRQSLQAVAHAVVRFADYSHLEWRIHWFSYQ